MTKYEGFARAGAALLLVAAAAGGCGGPTEETVLTVYSGRNERLIGPLIERFREHSGIETRVRYGGTPELAASLMEEGRRTPADVFISQDAAALGALTAEGLSRQLPDDILDAVPEQERSPAGDWVGLSRRARVVVYNTESTAAERVPHGLQAVTDPAYRGRFGVAPGNASFQAHMAAYLAEAGEDALRELLAGMAANEPRIYRNNAQIVEAVLTGEIDWGLVNHYYLMRALHQAPERPGANLVMTDGPAAGFVNLAGAALLRDSEAGLTLLRFLLSDEAQAYFEKQTFELRVTGAAARSTEAVGAVDFVAVGAALERAQTLIHESGLSRFR